MITVIKNCENVNKAILINITESSM